MGVHQAGLSEPGAKPVGETGRGRPLQAVGSQGVGYPVGVRGQAVAGGKLQPRWGRVTCEQGRRDAMPAQRHRQPQCGQLRPAGFQRAQDPDNPHPASRPGAAAAHLAHRTCPACLLRHQNRGGARHFRRADEPMKRHQQAPPRSGPRPATIMINDSVMCHRELAARSAGPRRPRP